MSSEDDPKPGERVAGTQYVVGRTLGRGGHGVVLEVEHAFLAKTYVMKLLHGTLSERDEVAKRMRAEARILARIEHPNIVRVVDGGMTAELNSRPYFVMSALRGEPLLDVLRRRGIGIGTKAAVHVALDVLDALDAAHMQHQLVHRDIKPANIFLHRVSPNEVRAVLLDFGVARVLASPMRQTQGPTFLGTLRYAAPEQLRGEATFASDLYAVAICLFETLTGKHPLGVHKAHEDWVRAHTRTEPMRLRDFVDGPASLEAFLLRAMAKKEEDRFASAYAMANQLRALLGDLPETDEDAPTDETEAMVLEHALTTVSRKTAWVPAAAAAEAPAALQSTADDREPKLILSEPPASPPEALAAFRPSRGPLPDTWKKLPSIAPPAPATSKRWMVAMAIGALMGFGIAFAWSRTAKQRAPLQAETMLVNAAAPTPAPDKAVLSAPPPELPPGPTEQPETPKTATASKAPSTHKGPQRAPAITPAQKERIRHQGAIF